jgi:hypothetical protein
MARPSDEGSIRIRLVDAMERPAGPASGLGVVCVLTFQAYRSHPGNGDRPPTNPPSGELGRITRSGRGEHLVPQVYVGERTTPGDLNQALLRDLWKVHGRHVLRAG